MSLLSGISFIKKESRGAAVKEDTRSESRRKRHRNEEMKSKYKHKHSKRRHKENKKEFKSDSSSGDSEDDQDGKEVLTPAEMQELAMQKSREGATVSHQSTSADKFSELMNRASKWKENVSDAAIAKSVGLNTTTSDAPVHASPTPASRPSSNQSAAALLRARLKMKDSLPPPQAQMPPASSAPPAAALTAARLSLAAARAPQISTGQRSSTLGLGRLSEAASEDIDSIYARNVMRLGKHFKGRDMVADKTVNGASGADEEEEEDLSLYEQREGQVAVARRQIAKALRDEQRYESAVQRCRRCRSSPMDLYVGSMFVLRLKPSNFSLASGHCELLPRHHIESFQRLDDDSQEELLRVKTLVRAMHGAETGGCSCFIETSVQHGQMPHARLDCIPIEKGIEAELRFSIREALTDINSEFAQNAKIFEVSTAKPLRRLLPPHVEYVSCEWSGSGTGVLGVAAIISDEGGKNTVNSDYMLDVVAAVLGEDSMRMRRGSKADGSIDEKEARRFRGICERLL